MGKVARKKTEPVQENTSEKIAEEAALDKLVEVFLKAKKGTYPPERVNLLREELRPNVYVGEYVIFRDTRVGRGRRMSLLKRTVLFHSKDICEANKFMQTIPRKEWDYTYLDFIDDQLFA